MHLHRLILLSLGCVCSHTCVSLLTWQVAERALFLWNNEAVATLILHHANEVLPIVIGALERNAESHWNEVRRGLQALALGGWQGVLLRRLRRAGEERREPLERGEARAAGTGAWWLAGSAFKAP